MKTSMTKQALLRKIRTNQEIASRLYYEGLGRGSVLMFVLFITLFFSPLMAITFFLFLLALVSLLWFLTMFQVRCPSCDKGLATLAAAKTHPFCPYCGVRAFADTPFQEKMILAAKQRKTDFSILKEENADTVSVSWAPVETDWKPLWEKNSLKQRGNALHFEQPKRKIILTSAMMLIIGIAMMIFYNSGSFGAAFVGGQAFYLVASAFVWLYLLFSLLLLETKIFDRETGSYYETARFYNEQDGADYLQNVALADIAGLQLLSVHSGDIMGNRHGDLLIYQLNLVLKNGKRITVVLSKHQKAIIDDAKTLSNFLNVTLIYCFQDRVFSELYEECN